TPAQLVTFLLLCNTSPTTGFYTLSLHDALPIFPEAAQGALALQVRAGEENLVAGADAFETRRRVEVERACVARVGAGCLAPVARSEEHTSELQSRSDLVCRLLLEKKKT